jgi:hypothetical protein
MLESSPCGQLHFNQNLEDTTRPGGKESFVRSPLVPVPSGLYHDEIDWAAPRRLEPVKDQSHVD